MDSEAQDGAATARLTIHSFGATDRGRVRESNQDQFINAKLSGAMQLQQSSLPQAKTLHSERHGHLFIVADGMGGMAGGEEASALALVTIEDFVLNSLEWFYKLQGEGILGEFQDALRAADSRVFAEAARHPRLKGMGTTLTMGYSAHSALYVAHVGDSRCYLLRGATLYQLTSDHTLVSELVRKGAISEADAEHSQFKNIVTNSVGGTEPGIKPEVHKVPLAAGDVALFCSDGLHGLVTDEQIAAVLRSEPEAERACKKLIGMANEAGGRDNITAIVVRVGAAADDAAEC